MKKQIEVSKETREKLEKVFNCSRMSVWRALSFSDDSDQSKRIRTAALKSGGTVMVTSPEVETIHDANGYMRQWFGNGALIEVNKNNGHADVYDRHGLRRQQADDLTIQQLYVMQEFAARL